LPLLTPVWRADVPKFLVFSYHGLRMTLPTESAPSSRRRALRDSLLYGICGGVLIMEHSSFKPVRHETDRNIR